MAGNQPRIDKSVTRSDYQDWMADIVRPINLTPDGFLTGSVVLTTIGVYSYALPDGGVRRELRLPEEVFAAIALDSLRMKPLTKYHPQDGKPVSPENSQQLQVGSVGEISSDSYRVYGTIMVTRQDAIVAVQNKELPGLSCGYSCDLEWVSGVWFGQQYDCIQRHIVYNHVALVPAGRAGDDATIRYDSAEIKSLGVGVCSGIPVEFHNDNKEGDMPGDLKVVRVDGVDFQAEAPVIVALTKTQQHVDALQVELTTAKQKLSTTEAERDSAREKVDAAEAKLKKLDSETPAQVQAEVKARLDCLEQVRKLGITEGVDASMDCAKMKAFALTKKSPKLDLTNKDAAYIGARFDQLCEDVAAGAEADHRGDAADILAGNTAGAAGMQHGDQKDEEVAARQRMSAHMDSAWQDSKGGK